MSGAEVDFWTVTPWLLTAEGNCELASPLPHLRENLVGVRVRLDIEIGGQLHGTIVRIERIHVFHVVHPGHLLLDGNGDGLLHGKRVRPRISGIYLDLRISDVGKLRDRQTGHGHDTHQHHQDGNHHRNNGAVDEEFGHDSGLDYGPSFEGTATVVLAGDAAGATGFTVIPSRTFWIPSDTTRSPAFMFPAIIQFSPDTLAGSHRPDADFIV